MADKNHSLATKMLHHHGFLTRSDVTSEFVGRSIVSDFGRADIFASHKGQSFGIEVKRGDTSWRHHPKWNAKKKRWEGGWTFRQREWGAMSMEIPFCTPYYVFLTMGTKPASWNPEKYDVKRSWLIPLVPILEAVQAIEAAGMMSMPYKIKKGIRRVYQDNGWSATELFSEYELQWNQQNSLVRPDWFFDNAGKEYGGFWTIPESHEFYQRYLFGNNTASTECVDLTEVKNGIRESIPSPSPNAGKPAGKKRNSRRGSGRKSQSKRANRRGSSGRTGRTKAANRST